MTELCFKIGQRTETIEVEPKNIEAVLDPARLPQGKDPDTLINDALDHPIKAERLEKQIHPGEKTVIIISDNTRPVPSHLLLPPLVNRLHQAGLEDKDIQIVTARGSHRNCSEAEMEKLTGSDLYHTISVTNSGAHGYIHLGATRRGTPVDIDADVVQADHRILTGNVEFHYFAGFSGGAKAIFPGTADPQAVAYNHRWMTSSKACAGQLEGNPVREDLEEAAALAGPSLLLNVVLNTHKEPIYAAYGDVQAAHRNACAYLSHIYLSPIHQKADIVIVSQGGAPKDLNLYQTQKALDNAGHAVKDGGVIILVGSCREGFGNPVFARWMKSTDAPDEIIQRLKNSFELGGHKAAAIAMIRQKAEIYLVSDMDPKELEGTMLKPYASLADAFHDAVHHCGNEARIIAMPYGGSTLPVLKSYA